jgi:hypothetical protein
MAKELAVVSPAQARPVLDEHDFKTVLELYAHAQAWARHYDTLVVSGNVVLVSASILFVGLAVRERLPGLLGPALLAMPILLSLVGVGLTRTLFGLYADSVERLIRFENVLNCFDSTKLRDVDSCGSFLPRSLMTLPIHSPASVRFFYVLYLGLMVGYTLLISLRLQS